MSRMIGALSGMRDKILCLFSGLTRQLAHTLTNVDMIPKESLAGLISAADGVTRGTGVAGGT
jgi:hypothetical protein